MGAATTQVHLIRQAIETAPARGAITADDRDALLTRMGASIAVGCDKRLPRTSRAYTRAMTESRIVGDHRIMGGVPCIRGTRIPVATVVGLFAVGQSVDVILADYPQLTVEDVRAALEFAAAAVSERQVPLRTPA